MKKKTAMILGMMMALTGLSLLCFREAGRIFRLKNSVWQQDKAIYWEESAARDMSTRRMTAAAVSGGREDTGGGQHHVNDAPVRDQDAQMRKIALTFDDGPHPFYTEQLLDGLKERGVKATFFVTGEHAALHPDMILRMQEEGHLIGNHTYSHIQLRSDNRERFREELIETNDVISQITGREVVYVRPPYGSWDKSLEPELNMFPVLWTVDPLDWCSSSAACVTGRIVGHVKENDIILMHDYYETSVTAALQVVDELQEQGYTFVTVDEILFD